MVKFFKRIVTLWRDFRSFRLTMVEWLGEGGKPVEKSVADSRAKMCMGCKFNGWSSEWNGIDRQIKAKEKAGIKNPDESKIGVCLLCRCWLPLKIHVPHKHIRSYQREAVRCSIMNEKPDCWQLRKDD